MYILKNRNSIYNIKLSHMKWLFLEIRTVTYQQVCTALPNSKYFCCAVVYCKPDMGLMDINLFMDNRNPMNRHYYYPTSQMKKLRRRLI